MRKTSLLAVLAAAAAIAPAARADVPTYTTFTLTSITDPAFNSFIFTVPSMPDPSSIAVGNGEFTIAVNATVTSDTTSSMISDDIQFYDGPSGGGISDDFFFEPYGSQVFSGTLNAPTFLDGTYDLSNLEAGGPTDYVLTVSSTPEPSSLMLLGTGALSLAGVARRRFTK